VQDKLRKRKRMHAFFSLTTRLKPGIALLVRPFNFTITKLCVQATAGGSNLVQAKTSPKNNATHEILEIPGSGQ
jgi:hypothetical protein